MNFWLLQAVTTGPPRLEEIVFAAAAIGLIVNTLAVLGVALKGGRLLGRMETSVEGLSTEVKELRKGREDNALLIARAVTQLDDVERRVERLERSNDV